MTFKKDQHSPLGNVSERKEEYVTVYDFFFFLYFHECVTEGWMRERVRFWGWGDGSVGKVLDTHV